MDSEHKINGSHVVKTRAWIDGHLGSGKFHALACQRDSEWPEGILPSRWYDIYPMLHALERAVAELDMSVQEAVTEIAATNARDDLRTIYRAFLWVANPRMFLVATPKLWCTYVGFGECRNVENGHGNYVGECEGVPHDLLDWAAGAWMGFLPVGIELAGGSVLKAEISERGPEEGSSQTSRLRCVIHHE